MSHFNVMVIGRDPEKLLEPYNEEIEEAPYPNDSPEVIWRKFKWSELLAFRAQFNGDALSNLQKKTIALKVRGIGDVPAWWWKEYTGEDMDENGWGLLTYNRNSKWDWYSLGGRWTGALPLKKGAEGKLGMPSLVFGDKPKRGYVDRCRVGDVDWQKLHKRARAIAAEQWDALFKPYDPETCWYNEEYTKSQQKVHMDLYGTKKEYVARRGYWTTYALLSKKHGWVAPGEMGFWGMRTDETENRDEYDRTFVRIMKSLPKNTTISVYDCHI